VAAFAETYGVGVFRLHKVIGFAGDLVPLKMTIFLGGKRNFGSLSLWLAKIRD
jgi:hypothetical protein